MMKYTNSSQMNEDMEEFSETMQGLCENVTQVIETGTFKGLGSTKVFAKTGKPIITLEGRKVLFKIAKQNLKNYHNVKIVNGMSLKKGDMAKFIIYDTFLKEVLLDNENNLTIDKNAILLYGNYPSNQNVNHIPVNEGFRNAQLFYFNEILGEVDGDENLLWDLINNDKKQLIFLDSCGYCGYLEFLKVMELDKDRLHKKILVMDDINHIKHYRSKSWLIAQGYVFHDSKTKRWGWTDFELLLKPNPDSK